MKKITLVLTFALVLALALALLVGCGGDADDANNAATGDTSFANEGVAAVVNGETITTEQLDAAVGSVDGATRAEVLSMLVFDRRLRQIGEEIGSELPDVRIGQIRDHPETVMGDASVIRRNFVALEIIVVGDFFTMTIAEIAREEGVEVAQSDIDDLLAHPQMSESVEGLKEWASEEFIQIWAEATIATSVLHDRGIDTEGLQEYSRDRVHEIISEGDLTIYDPEVRETGRNTWFHGMEWQ